MTIQRPGGAAGSPRRAAGWRRVAFWFAGLLLAVALGLASAWAVLRGVSSYGAPAGPWRVSLLAGAADADPWTRARVALGGLLALHRSEAMYYVASEDSNGAPLRARCVYRVTGSPPPGQWWSITAYADDLFLFDHPERRYSVHGDGAVLDSAGRFSFLVGGAERPASAGSEPWLPTPGDRGLVLTLRVYRPDQQLLHQPHALAAPIIERTGACA
jgi:hypothetical protein